MLRQILIIHNDNIPSTIRDLKRELVKDDDFEFTSLSIGSPRIGEDYDSFLSKRFKDEEIKLSKEYNLIVLPYSLSKENPLEYSGIRCAAHIRLFRKNPNRNKPFLFIGLDQLEELVRMSSLERFLQWPS